VRNAPVLAACTLCVVLLARPRLAVANGRFPASNQILFSPSDPRLGIVRTTYGVLVSHDDGGTWRWLCEDALGLSSSSSEDPSLGLTAGGALVVGIYSGLEVSADTGCSWSSSRAVRDQRVVDVAVAPEEPHSIVALTSTYEADGGASGGIGYSSQVYRSTDDGANWGPLGAPIDPTVTTTTLDVAPSDPARLYVVGYRAAATPGTPLLFVSTDAGSHWTEHAMPPLDHEVAVYIAGVDPSDADIVYFRSQAVPNSPQAQSRLFYTRDAGATFQVALTLSHDLVGFALSPDGAKVYVGSVQDGVLVADRTALDGGAGAFQMRAQIHVQCLATHGAELWACSDEASGFVAGVSTDDGASFAPRLHLQGIAGPLACAPGTTAARCAGAPFDQLCSTLGGCSTVDAGGFQPARTYHAACACELAGPAPFRGRAVAAAALVAILTTARALRRALTTMQRRPGQAQVRDDGRRSR
jgi:hypothetical protein